MSSARDQVGLHISSDPDATRIEQPRTEAAREALRLPFRVVFAADLAPHRRLAPDEPAHLRRVDPHHLADLMRELAPRIEVEVDDRLGGSSGRREVVLTFTEMRDFRPERVARQVPPLARLLDVRTLVADVRDGRTDPDAFRQRLGELRIDRGWADELYRALAPTESPPRRPVPRQHASGGAPSDAALDRLFDMVDAGDVAGDTPEERSSSGIMDALVGAATGDSAVRPRTVTDAAERMLDDLDAALGRQLAVILGHPDLRRLEAAWRGLALLVDRLDFRRDVELDVLPVHRAQLDDALYHTVVLPEHDEQSDRAALSLVVLDFAFSHDAADVALLEELAATAASVQVPFVGNLSHAFFGVEREAGIERLPVLWQQLEQPEYIAWNKLRTREDVQHLALVLPSFRLREPYGSERPVSDFAFEEDDGLWGGASLLVALAAAESYARTGSPTHLTAHPVADLVVGGTAASPLAARLTTERERELGDAGFVVLRGRADAAHVVHAPMLGRPPVTDDAAATRQAQALATLPSRLFTALLPPVLLALRRDLEADTATGSEAHRVVERRLRRWLGVDDGDDAVLVERRTDAGRGDEERLVIRLRPPDAVLEAPVRIVMGLPVPRATG